MINTAKKSVDRAFCVSLNTIQSPFWGTRVFMITLVGLFNIASGKEGVVFLIADPCLILISTSGVDYSGWKSWLQSNIISAIVVSTPSLVDLQI